MKNIFLLLSSACILFTSCNSPSQTEKEISEIQIDFNFILFHKLFFNADEKKLPKLKKDYPYLFPTNITDNQWLNKIEDSDEKILFKMADSLYGSLDRENKQFHSLYQHIKYYSPSFNAPKTITLINGLDYENSIVYADSLLFISLDMYLGKDSEVYKSFPEYISNNYTKDHIAVDAAKKIIPRNFTFKRGRSFLESMIYYGKELYLLKSFLPTVPIHIVMGYEEEKYNWALHNEAQIWKYFISKNLLFSTDPSLNNRFINTAPFSKFYFDRDAESPGRIGTWIGLKIVESYMNHNNSSVNEMLNLDAETILNQSKYKPTK